MYSPQFGASYHSKYGAIKESRHVFIEAGLFPSALNRKELDILEIGLGTGLNAFLTLLEAEKRGIRIRYEALEAFPLPLGQVVHLNYPAILEAEDFSGHFLAIHQSSWDEETELTPTFIFRKHQKRFEDADYPPKFDLIYFDPFAPDIQPELWEIPLLSSMYDALRPDGILVTYCAKGIVKRRLKSLGFEVEALKGPPGKREMTRCVKP